MVRPKEGEPQILNDELLLCLMDEGMSMADIGRRFGITRQAIFQRKRKIGKFVSRSAVIEHGAEIVQKEIDFGQQLLMATRETNKLLNTLKVKEDKESQELTIRALGEIRQQVTVWHNIRKDLFTMKEMVEVINEILNTIEEVDADVKGEILRRLRKKGLLRGVFPPD